MTIRTYAKWKIWLLDKIAYVLRVDVRINAIHYGHVVWDVEDDAKDSVD